MQAGRINDRDDEIYPPPRTRKKQKTPQLKLRRSRLYSLSLQFAPPQAAERRKTTTRQTPNRSA